MPGKSEEHGKLYSLFYGITGIIFAVKKSE